MPIEPEPPPAEPAPPVVTDSGPLGEIQKMWPGLLALIKSRHKATVAALLAEGRATALTDNEVTITFAPAYSFHREQLSDRERLEFVEKCLAEVAGREIRIKLAEAGGTSEGAGESPGDESGGSKAPRRRTKDSPGVPRAVELFGGRGMEAES